jgi:putative peptidoglycan lipid II flippase
MVCTALSRVLGFVRMFVFAFLFGHTGTADVINAVFRIPESLRMLFAEGALSSAFIPTLSTALVEDPSGERARRIVRNLLGFILAAVLPLCVLGVFFSRQLTGLLINFSDPQMMDLAGELFPYIIWFLPAISLSAILMGALNARHRFGVPAITPILFSLTVIASLLWLPVPLPYRMITGIVSGGLAQVLFQLPAFLRARYSVRPDFRFNNKDFKRVLVQWLPVVFSASIFAVNNIVANLFASGLEPGSVSALQYAVIYFQLPMGIFANSIITVLFPRLSRQAALNDHDGLKETLRYGLRFMLLLLVPSTLLLVFLGEDVIGFTLQHGAFTRAGTLQTNPVLTGFSLGLFSTGALFLFQRLFYALKDYRRPLVTAGIILAVDVGLSFLLKETSLRVTGLALANTIAFTVGVGIFAVLARSRLGRLGLRRLVFSGFRVAIGNIPLGIIIAAYLLWARPAAADWSFWARLILLGATALVGFAATIGMYVILKIDIIKDIIKERFRKTGRT